MLSPHPLIHLRLAVTDEDGDTAHDVIATAAGIPEREASPLFDAIRSAIGPSSAALSLTVGDSVLCELARFSDVLERFVAVARDELKIRRAA